MHDIWNPWHGCKKCSAGCQNCYMYALDNKREVQTPSSVVHKTGSFKYPLSKSRDKQYKVKTGERIRVNMTSDTFIDEADEWRDEMWSIIKQRSDVVFWLLTKRPERILDHLPSDWGDGYDNVSLNCTCENQEMFDKRIDVFLNVPAKHKGLCLAPLLGPIDISKALSSGQIEEISVGGENYDNPRPVDYAWVQNIAEQCKQHHINFCWYETGTNLIVGGDKFFMPNKHKQAVEAWFSGLNQYYYDINFDLKYADGSVVPKEDYCKPMFNNKTCVYCANQNMCNGCSNCGKCGNISLMDKESFVAYQDELFKSGYRPY